MRAALGGSSGGGEAAAGVGRLWQRRCLGWQLCFDHKQCVRLTVARSFKSPLHLHRLWRVQAGSAQSTRHGAAECRG